MDHADLGYDSDRDSEIGAGHAADPAASLSLNSSAYTERSWFELEREAVLGRSWQWLCHQEKLQGPGSYVLNVIPVAPDRTLETYDFFLESAEPNEAERESIRYLDEVLQVEDIALVESVQRGMASPAFTQGRIVHDPSGSGLSEHAVHHFHGLVLDAYSASAGERGR